MFKLPRSTWADYDIKLLLSHGGGVHRAQREVDRDHAGSESAVLARFRRRR